MTQEHKTLLTVSEAAKLLHVSDDTVRRQIKEGDLDAIQIGTTPKGRPRLRIPSAAVEQKLRQRVPHATPSIDRLREAFSGLTDEQKEALIEEAVRWARAQEPEVVDATPRLPEPTKEEIERRLTGRLVTKKRAG